MAEFTSPRFISSDTLRQCLNGVRTVPPQNGALREPDHDAVKSIQRALVDLGYLLDYTTEVDGIYGAHTADAVHRFKADRGISPSDGVVGPRTSKALDEAFPSGPLDQGPFASFVSVSVSVSGTSGARLDGTIAGLLNKLRGSPLPWASQTGIFALQELDKNNLAGIVRASRISDLVPFVPASEKARMASTANVLLGLGETGGVTHWFDQAGWTRGYIVVPDALADRATEGNERNVGLMLVLAHELHHFRNRALLNQLQADPVNDDNYVDKNFAIAAGNAPLGSPPSMMRATFIAEVAARHQAWKVFQELIATRAEAQLAAGIIKSRTSVDALKITLQPGQLFRATHAFASRESHSGQAYFDTGYMSNLAWNNPGMFNKQVANWMRDANRFSYHDIQVIDDNTRNAIANEFNFVTPAFTINARFPIAGLISF